MQCDQIGAIFENYLCQGLFIKLAQMYGDFLASSKTFTFQVKTAVATFGQLWATFNFNIWSH